MSRLVDDDAEMLLSDLHAPEAAHPSVLEARLRNKYLKHLTEVRLMVTQPGYWRAQYRAWRDIATVGKGERLVDAEVMSWAYLEGGIIQCLGGLLTFFVVLYSFGITPSDAVRAQKGKNYFLPHGPDLTVGDGSIVGGPMQYEALKEAQSSFYLSILLIQIWNLFACKARIRLPFGRFIVE
ncbi:hypothetical protein HK104_003835 [Borealophlyctis nickersoniae]|nr:hypothetical protein HK104_003835 [Borealophlyctis nickersoniae]